MIATPEMRRPGWFAVSGSPLCANGARVVQWRRIAAESGLLVVAEQPDELPFVVRRVFALLQVTQGEVRGTHAHKVCEQFLVCVAGSVTAIVDDGSSRAEVVLDDPAVGLYMPPLTWGTQYRYSPDAVLVVFASEPYDADDYIHDYEEFRSVVGVS